jgi:hypothetical protein
MIDGFFIDPLTEQLRTREEESVEELLSSFLCPLNKDIELFLKERSIDFSKSSSARTYLVFNNNEPHIIAGYFAIAQKSIVIEKFSGISKTFEKKIRWFSDEYMVGKGECSHAIRVASVILIAQFGKNFTNDAAGLITGQELMSITLSKISEIQHVLGGRFVSVECEDTPSLIDFYNMNGFVRLQNRPKDKGDPNAGHFVQLVRTS